MTGNGTSGEGAEGTVSSGRSDRRNGSSDLGGKAKVLDGGKGCKEEMKNRRYILESMQSVSLLFGMDSYGISYRGRTAMQITDVSAVVEK